MNTTRYPRFLFTFLGCCLVFLLAACGSGGTNSGTTPTPTRGNATVTPPATATALPPTQTSCPAAGTARAAVMAPLALGNQQNIVYIVNEFQGQTSTFGTLKRYDVATGAKTEIVKISNVSISDAQVSADGQWIIFTAVTTSHVKLQLVRLDGQALQTIYCATPASNGANPSSVLSNVQWSTNQQLAVFNSYTGPASYLYLLNLQNGALQTELSTNSGVIDTPLTWLDNTRLYLYGPEVDAPPQALYLLDTSRGANQNPNNLPKVFDATSVTATTNFCWNADSSFDGTRLFTSQCTTTPNPNGPGIGSQLGPSKISARPATGGAPQNIFTSQNMAITAIRSISKTTLLLPVNNNGTGTNVDTSHNGLWKVNTDGTGLTQLASGGAGVSGGPSLLCTYTQYPWSNVSRDGSLFALQHNSANGQTQSLLFGSLSGGTPTVFASISNGTSLGLVGWTTM
jgi:dipeptidyl aminopeptidase/acylaminoacyl peptidase